MYSLSLVVLALFSEFVRCWQSYSRCILSVFLKWLAAFVFIFFNLTRILSFIFSVFYVTLTFPCHKVTWFSIVCIASALLLFGLKKDFNDNPKRFLINHEHFGAAFLFLLIFFDLRILYVMSGNISAARLALLFADEKNNAKMKNVFFIGR